jgi:hypothetical protein
MNKRWIIALTAVAVLLALRFTGLSDLLSLDTLARHRATLTGWVAANPLLVGAAYVALYTAAVAFSVPGAVVLTLSGGFLFGAVLGTTLTVLAATAAQADAAASMIANAVNVDHPGIVRQPAHSLRDMTDLGDLAVTVDVPRLPAHLVHQALQNGWQCARECQAQGLMAAAFLVCQGQSMALTLGGAVDGEQVSCANDALALA